MSEIKCIPAGDNGIILELGSEISIEINKRIREIIFTINESREQFHEIIEMIPAYTSILVIYNPLETTFVDLVGKITTVVEKVKGKMIPSAKVIHVPIIYGGEFGPDLSNVAQHNRTTEEEIIQLHKSVKYLIYMIGFTPGFPYLGGMREEIATPRLQSPRKQIPAGSVGIAGNQTGIYPIESPGGWQLIGRTPLKLFDPNREPVVLFQIGDYLNFEEVSPEEYWKIEEAVYNGTYQVNTVEELGY